MATTTLTEKTIHQLGGDDRRTRGFYSRLGADLAKRHDKAIAASLVTEPVVEKADRKVERIKAKLAELADAKAELEAKLTAAVAAHDQARAADAKSAELWAPVDHLAKLYPDVAELVGYEPLAPEEPDEYTAPPDAEPPELGDHLDVWRRHLGGFEVGPTHDLAELADAVRAAGVPIRLIERVLLRRRAWLDERRRDHPCQNVAAESKSIGEALVILR